MIVGIPACAKMLSRHAVHQTPARYAEAVLRWRRRAARADPAAGRDDARPARHLDGLLVPGSPSNVHPTHYAGGESETPDFHDLERDHTTLPLIRAAVERGIPVLAICRGIQELNVALGGTLIQRVHA